MQPGSSDAADAHMQARMRTHLQVLWRQHQQRRLRRRQADRTLVRQPHGACQRCNTPAQLLPVQAHERHMLERVGCTLGHRQAERAVQRL